MVLGKTVATQERVLEESPERIIRKIPPDGGRDKFFSIFVYSLLTF